MKFFGTEVDTSKMTIEEMRDLKKEVILGLRQLEYMIQTAEMANHKYGSKSQK